MKNLIDKQNLIQDNIYYYCHILLYYIEHGSMELTIVIIL